MECPICGNEVTKKKQLVPNNVCFLYVCTDPSCEITKIEVTAFK